MLKNILKELIFIYSKQLSFVKSNLSEKNSIILKHLSFIKEELEKLKDDLEIIEIESKTKAVVSYLSLINSENIADDYKEIVKKIKVLADKLCWKHGYQNPSQEMIEKYAYAEIIGPEGPIYSKDLIIGFVLLAPDFYYPQHRHNGIEESYLFLTAETFYNKNSILAEGSFVLNKAGKMHELKSAAKNPNLILYAWIEKEKGSLKDYQLKL